MLIGGVSWTFGEARMGSDGFVMGVLVETEDSGMLSLKLNQWWAFRRLR